MLIRRIRHFFGGAKLEAALRAEMEQHLEEKVAELQKGGLSEPDAQAEARRLFGNFSLKQEESRDVWVSRYWSNFRQDLRYGLRNLARAPGFTAIAVLSAALGIGICSTVFSIVNAAIFQPLPVSGPDRLMAISGVYRKAGIAGQTLSFAEIRDLRKQRRYWEGIAAFAPLLSAGIRPEGGDVRQHWGFLVTANYFDVVAPGFAVGKGFVEGEDDTPGAPPRIVLTHDFWIKHFGGDPAIVGRTIQVNKHRMNVAGVTSQGFRGTEPGLSAEFFLPLSQVSEMRRLGENPQRMTSYGSHWLLGLGRLKPGVGIRQGRAELDSMAREILDREPNVARDRGFYAEQAGKLLPGIRKIVFPTFLLLFAITFLALLIACVNIANLLLARASARSREIAIRLAIGAGRGRLICQLMTESILLAVGGGLIGVVLTVWAGQLIRGFHIPLSVPIDLTISIDYRVVLFTAALSGITGIAFGLVPAFRATRSIRSGSQPFDSATTSGPRRVEVRNALVVAQVAAAAMLVTCSALFLRGLDAYRQIDTGMDTRNLVLFNFDPSLIQYDERQTQRLLLDMLHDAEESPGIQSVSVTNLMPLSIGGNFTRVRSSGQTSEGGEHAAVMAVSPRYFETMGIPILAGADFRPAPSEEEIAIVNLELARRLYPDQDALGRTVFEGGRGARIVAVVANSRFQIQEPEVIPIFYRPVLDTGDRRGSSGSLTLIARTPNDPQSMTKAIRQQIQRRDPELVVTAGETMDLHVERSLFAPRLAASLFSLCGAIGLLIATIGVYGVVNYSVARRTREIGIRMALGSPSSQVVRIVLRHGMTVALVGIFIGLAGGLALSRVIRSLIHSVSATDPVALAAGPVILLIAALLAMIIPALRAALVDPTQVLKAD